MSWGPLMSCIMLILAIGLGLPSFLSLVEGYVPGTTIAFAATTAGASAAIGGTAMAFQNYDHGEALLCILLSGAIGIGVTRLMPGMRGMRGMTLMPLISLAFLVSHHSAI
ncbi:hypothetical protein Sa4125_21350 [Aureimonas sp. SA4125]|uniref:hypothetical protein n=1 Tax=Aureimonas sp. SA4125 TaxID=2826993 RepID=UPI001CC456E9|nr:hypothetical protein [Aureimonas sp. SA4125]BDA84593.1 hypothetical protein Sa4125_21350 [Aureimonas sp. SA4125]